MIPDTFVPRPDNVPSDNLLNPYFHRDRFPDQVPTDEAQRFFSGPMHSPLLGVPMDHPFRDQYTPSEDGRTPPFSDYSSPSQLAPEDEFPASTLSVDPFEQLGIQDAFHPDQNLPPSPPPVFVFHNERYTSCTVIPGHIPQSFDHNHQPHSPDDLHDFLPMSHPHPYSGPGTRIRRWSSGADDMSNQRRSLSNSSPPSIRNSPCISKSVESNASLSPLLLVPGASHDYQTHFPSNAPPGIDTIVTSNDSFHRNLAPDHREAQNSLLFDTPNHFRHIHPMTHAFPQDISRAEPYSNQYSGSYHSLGGGPPYHLSAQPQYTQPTALTQTDGPKPSSSDLHHRLLSRTSNPLRMIKPTVTSNAVRKASNNRIRHLPKHVCPDCDERFTTSGNLRNHKNSHYGIKPYRCDHPGCGREFVTKSDCKRHGTKVHENSRRLGPAYD